MILPDKRPEQTGFANLTDYSQKCPKDLRSWFCFVRFSDDSLCLLSNIFAANRLAANAIVFSRFADCLPYMAGWSLQEAFD